MELSGGKSERARARTNGCSRSFSTSARPACRVAAAAAAACSPARTRATTTRLSTGTMRVVDAGRAFGDVVGVMCVWCSRDDHDERDETRRCREERRTRHDDDVVTRGLLQDDWHNTPVGAGLWDGAVLCWVAVLVCVCGDDRLADTMMSARRPSRD